MQSGVKFKYIGEDNVMFFCHDQTAGARKESVMTYIPGFNNTECATYRNMNTGDSP